MPTRLTRYYGTRHLIPRLRSGFRQRAQFLACPEQMSTANLSKGPAKRLNFITCSCYHRQPWLAGAGRRDLFLRVLEQVRKRYDFVVVGYVVMPEHIHLLISEPEKGDPSKVMQAIKQGFARRVLSQLRRRQVAAQQELFGAGSEHVWQHRFYDFNVWSARKRIEKLRYMHRNPGSPASPHLACWGGSRCSADW